MPPENANGRPRWYRVELYLDLVRRNLSREDRRVWTDDDVRKWLAEAGFVCNDQTWIVAEADLGQLRPEEVRRISAVE